MALSTLSNARMIFDTSKTSGNCSLELRNSGTKSVCRGSHLYCIQVNLVLLVRRAFTDPIACCIFGLRLNMRLPMDVPVRFVRYSNPPSISHVPPKASTTVLLFHFIRSVIPLQQLGGHGVGISLTSNTSQSSLPYYR